MATVLSNKRFQFHTESNNGGEIKLSGEVTIREDGTVTNFSGQVTPIEASESDPAMAYGNFNYWLNGDRVGRNVDVPAEYDEAACALLTQSVKEISEQVNKSKKA